MCSKGDVGMVRFDALREALDDRNKGYNRLTADLEAQQQRQQREKLQYQEQLQALQVPSHNACHLKHFSRRLDLLCCLHGCLLSSEKAFSSQGLLCR